MSATARDLTTFVPSDISEAAEAMATCGRDGSTLRVRGGATKFDWGAVAGHDAVIETSSLSGVVEHNAEDMTAIARAGTPLAAAQETFGAQGQMLALDPPLGRGDGATIGGIVATADSGPLRHRYGAARDLVLGMRVVLSDGTVARTGGRVIKNVAGYDLAKLFAGSFGTLGMIAEVVVRLHPRAPTTITTIGECSDPRTLQEAAGALAHAPLEMESLDVAYDHGTGRVLARFAGGAPERQADSAVGALRAEGIEARVEPDDEALWSAQRDAQRAPDGVVVKVSGRPTDVARLAGACDELGAAFVGRAALGLFWVRLGAERGAGAVDELRRSLAPRVCVVTDAPDDLRRSLDVWGGDPSAIAVMRRIKERFDPAGVCAPGSFVGGL